MFSKYFVLWDLEPDGDPIPSHASDLLPVTQHGVPAMLKIAKEAEERRGGRLMVWLDGDGAAQVFAHDEDAVLLERAQGRASLVEMAQNGRDDEASRIICAVAARLHGRRGKPAELTPLAAWFRELDPAATTHGGTLALAASTARQLLADPREECVLHGDIHHGNILDFGSRGWLAIDPKGLWGERGYDFANTFCNPYGGDTPLAPGRLARQATVVAEAAGLDRQRLLRWVLAYAGLSAAWTLSDGADPSHALAVARIAAAELDD